MSYYDFNIQIPLTKVGPGSCNQIHTVVKDLGSKKIIIITDNNILRAGLLENIQKSLQTGGYSFDLFDGCLPDAPSNTVDACCKIVKNGGYDTIIGFGGGSIMDTAKAVSLIVANNMSFNDFANNKATKKSLTKILIPTTAGTGSEWSRTGVYFDDEHEDFKVVFNEKLFADAVIIDPLTTSFLPQKVTAESGMDALCHAIEAYISPLANIFSDCLARTAIELIAQNLRLAFAKGESHPDARFRTCMAASMGMGAAVCASSGLAHMMNVEVGKRVKVSHGEIVTILLPPVMEFCRIGSHKKLADIAVFMEDESQNLGIMDAANESSKAVARIAKDVGMVRRLKDMGIKESDLPEMAEAIVTKWSSTLKEKVPRQVTQNDVFDIFKAAF